jgi:HSP20 family protein
MPEQTKAVEPAKKSTSPTPLKLVPPGELFASFEKLFNDISKRAFQIFEGNGKIFGHDLEHWFQAERELLHPVHVEVTEKDGAVTVNAEVPGFSEKDLEVNLEPRRLTITGKRESREERKEKNTIYTDHCSNQILRVIDLPIEVDTEKASATLKNGMLELKVPKAAPAKKIAISPAA